MPISLHGSQMAERLGNREVAGSIPGSECVSLSKALHPTCLGGNVPVLTVSRSVGISAQLGVMERWPTDL